MRIYDIIFPIITISLTIIFSSLINYTYGQVNETSTFEDYQNKNCPPMSLVLCTPDGGPRCPNGYHRSPDGDCEPAGDVPSLPATPNSNSNTSDALTTNEWNTTQQMQKMNQTSQTTKIYENRDVGIKFQYPSDWTVTDAGKIPCQSQLFCILSVKGSDTNYTYGFVLGKWPKEDCNCNSLRDFVKFLYQDQQQRRTGFSFINDNQTTIGKNYSGWQFEISYLQDGERINNLQVFGKNNDNYYSIGTVYSNESRGIVLPKFNKFIDSIEFLPIQVPKKPSFLNENETGQSNPSSMLESSSNELQILSDNSFTDSIGYMHVVGEVQNNGATNAQFVQVTGTFYDNNNQVVGTHFTYTNPSDIPAGDKAPFEIILSSASVPVSEINHYNLIASSQ